MQILAHRIDVEIMNNGDAVAETDIVDNQVS